MKAIKKIEQEREQRRLKMQEAKKEKQQKKAMNQASGKNVDIDFQLMIEKNKFKEKMLSAHQCNGEAKLAVNVRKRPIFKKQQVNGQIDAISAANPQIKIHQPKYKVDGITKYVQNHTFTFDNTFNQEQTTDDIYKATLKPLLPSLLKGGIVTCFAYGQTGSGKTFTMNGLQKLTVEELFELTKKNFNVTISFFQIYGGRCLDLLNEKSVLNILEDKSGVIQIPGLIQKAAGSSKQLLAIMDQANQSRTTHATVANDTSSRSHAICQVLIKKGNEQNGGKLVLVDLAGSERAQDTQSNNRQRRLQGAQINKSLLALKQCIRAMDDKADHVPFRASKLTLILRDSFVNKYNIAKVIMIACISPGSSSSDHSLNTLRYADRLKDQTELSKKCDEIIQQNKSLQAKQQPPKDNIQKIESAKMIKKEELPKNNNSSVNKANQKNVPKNIPKSYSSNQNSNSQKQVSSNQQLTAKKEQSLKDKQKNRANSYKKPLVNSSNAKNSSNPSLSKENNKSVNQKDNSNDDNIIDQEIQIEEKAKMENKKKVKDDLNAMKRTMRNEKNQEFFAFQQKVSNILEEQEEVFATHMAAIKQDAKLLTQESELISKIQGVGFMDYDVDSYVDKLESIIKKKMKMYTLLTKKVQNFKKYLKEEDEIRHKVKETFYY